MTEKKFNLVDEPWIKAVTTNGEDQIYNIKNIFLKAHEIAFLAGETEQQNTAILRLLIAISVTCFYRYDENGKENLLLDDEQALNRYKIVWKNSEFSEQFIVTYLEKWHDSLYLIGGNKAFYQVPEKYCREVDDIKNKAKNPTRKTYLVEPYRESDRLNWMNAQSFNGEVLQSGNSSSPFSNKSGNIRSRMTLPEAARWLLYYMNFADCSSKIPGKWNAGMTFTSSGANIHPVGRNLFETIMLCSVLLDSNEMLYNEPKPAWENNTFTYINDSPYGSACPDNIPELYTQQSRKIIMHCDGDMIDGVYVAAGDKYSSVNAFTEPMFAFYEDKSGKVKRSMHISSESSGWKEFRNVFGGGTEDPTRWVGLLFYNDILSDEINIPYVMTDISYGSMQCGVESTVSTKISVNEKFFVNTVELDRARIEVDRIIKISNIVNRFGQEMDLVQGAKGDKKGRIDSALGKRLARDYEKKAGEFFEKYLMDKIGEEELHNKEIESAKYIINNVLKDINIIDVIGHGEISIGNAELKFYNSMKSVRKNLGLINEGEKDKW